MSRHPGKMFQSLLSIWQLEIRKNEKTVICFMTYLVIFMVSVRIAVQNSLTERSMNQHFSVTKSTLLFDHQLFLFQLEATEMLNFFNLSVQKEDAIK